MRATGGNTGHHLVAAGDLDSLLLPLVSLPDSFNVEMPPYARTLKIGLIPLSLLLFCLVSGPYKHRSFLLYPSSKF